MSPEGQYNNIVVHKIHFIVPSMVFIADYCFVILLCLHQNISTFSESLVKTLRAVRN